MDTRLNTAVSSAIRWSGLNFPAIQAAACTTGTLGVYAREHSHFARFELVGHEPAPINPLKKPCKTLISKGNLSRHIFSLILAQALLYILT